MLDVPDSAGEPAGGRSPLTGQEWLLLLVLGSVQFTHILDFMIVMPLGPQFPGRASQSARTASLLR